MEYEINLVFRLAQAFEIFREVIGYGQNEFVGGQLWFRLC